MKIKTPFSAANEAFRQYDYLLAIALYEKALDIDKSQLKESLTFNLNLAYKRLQHKVDQLYYLGELSFKLNPKNQLQHNLESEGSWTSLGGDPYFFVEIEKKTAITAGWYLITFEIELKHKWNVAALYPDYGEGFFEENAISINYKSSNGCARIVKFDHDVVNLRFDPHDKSVNFYIRDFRICCLNQEQALAAMLSFMWERVKDKPEILWAGDSVEDVYLRYKDKQTYIPGVLSYQQWIEDMEAPSLPSMQEIETTLSQIQTKPLISVIIPTYNTVDKHLRNCIESVMRQSYPYWELCIADDASTYPHIRSVLEEYRRIEPRIKVVYRGKNGHISRASNSALEITTGDYVALLDHDDVLPRDSLYFVAIAIINNQEAKIIYSDEDKIDEIGVRSSPHFKSGWNEDLFYSQNYICHLGVYKRELLNLIGGFRFGVEGSQDQDLLLRCLQHVQNSQIIHIPRILYHWRIAEGSTALASGEKNYTTEAGIRSLRNYFSFRGPDGVTVEEGMVPNTYRVRWPIPEPAPLVSLIIPTRDRKTITEVAVRSIIDKTTYNNYEILIIDNGSVEPETLEWFSTIQMECPRVKVIHYDHPFNFSAINNFGVKKVSGNVIGLVNNDIEVISADWLTEMVSHCIRKDIGCVGAKLYYSNGQIQHGGVIVSLGGVAGHSHKYYSKESSGYFHRLKLTQNLTAVTAACLLVRRDVYEEVGGLDEEDLTVAFNDVDFCLKVYNAGYRNLWTPYAELYHHESISRGHEDTPEKQSRFESEVNTMKNRWGSTLTFDHFYNPNLTKKREDFSIRDNDE